MYMVLSRSSPEMGDARLSQPLRPDPSRAMSMRLRRCYAHRPTNQPPPEPGRWPTGALPPWPRPATAAAVRGGGLGVRERLLALATAKGSQGLRPSPVVWANHGSAPRLLRTPPWPDPERLPARPSLPRPRLREPRASRGRYGRREH